jgi:predicted transposase YbfD/YdcC
LVISGSNVAQAPASLAASGKLETVPYGIPSHDTFNRLFSRLKPEELQRCFIGWMQAVHQVTEGDLLNVLALKGNQGNLHEDVVQLFTAARKQNCKNIEHQFHSIVEKGHGRNETRSDWVMGNTEYLIGAKNWVGLQSIGMVESERKINGKSSIEQRYYILSINSDVQRFAQAVRSHWSIENQLH